MLNFSAILLIILLFLHYLFYSLALNEQALVKLGFSSGL